MIILKFYIMLYIHIVLNMFSNNANIINLELLSFSIKENSVNERQHNLSHAFY